MFDRLRKAFCRCKEVAQVGKYSKLTISKCNRCGKHWLYNEQDNHRITITEGEAEGLLAKWEQLAKK